MRNFCATWPLGCHSAPARAHPRPGGARRGAAKKAARLIDNNWPLIPQPWLPWKHKHARTPNCLSRPRPAGAHPSVRRVRSPPAPIRVSRASLLRRLAVGADQAEVAPQTPRAPAVGVIDTRARALTAASYPRPGWPVSICWRSITSRRDEPREPTTARPPVRLSGCPSAGRPFGHPHVGPPGWAPPAAGPSLAAQWAPARSRTFARRAAGPSTCVCVILIDGDSAGRQ